MKITILGSGTSTGVPMVGCRCPVCTSDDPRDRRTRSSLLVESAGRYLLVDTSTDLRRQAIRAKLPHIDAVLFTHTHADHIHGIDDLRGFHFIHRRVIPCFGGQATIDTLMRKFPYIFHGRAEEGYFPLLEPHVVGGPFSLFGCQIVPVPLQHGRATAMGYRFNNVAYLTDCSRIPETSLPLLHGLEVLIIDALRYTPHASHFNIAGALQAAAALRPQRTILTHLSHEVPYRDGTTLPPGVEFAYDGLTLTP
jgi:phosphoribosyl 1,2-cyclic phosphate phosphodiesterase